MIMKKIMWHVSKVISWRKTYLVKVIFILIVVLIIKLLNILIIIGIQTNVIVLERFSREVVDGTWNDLETHRSEGAR